MSFDAFHKWFGIPPNEQPPNLYRLLGIALHECDPEVIDAAANKQLRFLHDMSNGEHAVEAEELSNRVAFARRLLLDPARKAAYDLELRSNWVTSAKPLVAKNLEVTGSEAAIAFNASQIELRGAGGAGWYLRHRDNIEHGPYPIESLIDAAKRGHIAPDTVVRHPITTGGNWVLATSIPGVSMYCAIDSARQSMVEQQPTRSRAAIGRIVTRPSRHRTSIGYRMIAFVLRGAIPIALLCVTATFFYKRPDTIARLRQLLQPQQPIEPNTATTIAEKPKFEPIRSTTPKATRQPLESREGPPKSPRPESVIPNKEFFDVAPPPNSTLEHVQVTPLKLELDSTKWVVTGGELPNESKLRVVEISNFNGTLKFSPSSQELSANQTLRIEFADLFGLSLELRLSTADVDKQRALVGDWTYLVADNNVVPFSLSRMSSRKIAMIKAHTEARRALAIAIDERARHQSYLSSGKLKPLETTRPTEYRISQLNALILTRQTLVQQQSQEMDLFQAFSKTVEVMHKESELVISAVSDKGD